MGRPLSRRRLLGTLVAIPVVLLSSFAALTAIAAIRYPREYVWRILAWRDSDVGDFLTHFPQRVLSASPSPYQFDVALDERRVAAAFETAFSVDDFEAFLAGTATQAFVVVQDDRIVYESYFNGWRRDSMLTSYSVAKSFASTLVGIAIQEGFIGGIDDPITQYLPELLDRDPAFANITIRHLLTMSSGLDYQEIRWGLYNSDDALTSYYPDQRHISLYNTHIVDPPGEYFLYNKYHPQLLGLILERTTGMSVTEWTQTRVWDPLGMEFDGAWCLDSTTSGFEKMEAGLNARAIDFAKFGRLFLHDGDWNGASIVHPDWVALATGRNPAGRAPAFSDDEYYAFMWWGFPRENEPPDFAAWGDRGQFVYVSPANRLIIVRNGGEYGIDPERWPEGFYRAVSEL
ncbi:MULTISPECIES: serine hydrolase [Haloferax]|uniref:serine hydrolase domain-containing protein n=1 Tax=Haloferax TaxID=2251 RepID=UPI00177D0875|nr:MULTISPECIES: serine hydrolase [Haloferax]